MTCICGHGCALHASDQSKQSSDSGCRWPGCGCSYFQDASAPTFIEKSTSEDDEAKLRAAGMFYT